MLNHQITTTTLTNGGSASLSGDVYQGHIAIFHAEDREVPMVFRDLKRISLNVGFSAAVFQESSELSIRPDLILFQWEQYQVHGEEIRNSFRSPFSGRIEPIPIVLLHNGPDIHPQELQTVLENGVREVFKLPYCSYGIGLRINRLLKEQSMFRSELEEKIADIKSLNLIIQKISSRIRGIRKNLQFLSTHPGIGERGNEIHRMFREINKAIPSERSWKEHERRIYQQAKGFQRHLKSLHPNLTLSELEYCNLVKLNISRKEAADILTVTPAAIEKKRYRIKQKLGLIGRMSLEKYFERID